jgi:transposase
LEEGSLVVFDKGPNTKENIALVTASKMKYLSAKKLNKSDDAKRIKPFDKSKAEMINKEDGVYGIKYTKPSRIDYFYFSEKLCKKQLDAKYRKALRKYEEAVAIQKSIDNKKGLPKRFTINNELVDIKYFYQTKLNELPKEEALKLVRKAAITGREGFFCLVSTKDLTLNEALKIYRKKDSIEKIFNSLKNEIEIKPLRVWTPNSMNGAFLIGYLAQLIISLMRYEIEELRHISSKFIISAMKSLTLTVEFLKNGRKRHIFANFSRIVEAILCEKGPAG